MLCIISDFEFPASDLLFEIYPGCRFQVTSFRFVFLRISKLKSSDLIYLVLIIYYLAFPPDFTGIVEVSFGGFRPINGYCSSVMI